MTQAAQKTARARGDAHPYQKELPLRDARYTRPTMGVETARGILDVSEDELRELLERGAVWAWDVSTAGERPLLRFLTASVAALGRERAAELLADPFALCSPEPAESEEAIGLVLAGLPKNGKPWVTGKDVKRVLNFGRTHMIDLVAAGALPQVPGTQYRTGPKGYPLIPREALEAFLENRLTC